MDQCNCTMLGERAANIICIATFEFANHAKRFDFSFASSEIFLLEIDFN